MAIAPTVVCAGQLQNTEASSAGARLLPKDPKRQYHAKDHVPAGDFRHKDHDHLQYQGHGQNQAQNHRNLGDLVAHPPQAAHYEWH